MVITDRYISASAKLLDSKSANIVLSDDAYAIAEMVENLINKIEQTRLSWL